MEIIRSKNFTADRAWGSKTIAIMNGISTKIHWTNKPYKWHVNSGEEVFTVLDGKVEMHFKKEGKVDSVSLNAGDIFFASVGTEHVAPSNWRS